MSVLKKAVLPLAISAIVCSSSLADDSFSFGGYARLGTGFSDLNADGDQEDGLNVISGQTIIQAAGSPYKAAGRLGNEDFGYEFALKKEFINGSSKWDVEIALEDYTSTLTNLGVNRAYTIGEGFIPYQRRAKVWAGRRTPEKGHANLNDYSWMTNGGTGGGVLDLDFGAFKMDLSYVSGDAENSKGADGDRKAVVGRLHGIQFVESGWLDIHYGYGFSSRDDQRQTAQVAINYFQNHPLGWTEFSARYGHNTRESLLWGYGVNYGGNTTSDQDDTKAILALLEGSLKLTNQLDVEYLFLFELDDTNSSGTENKWSQAILRPSYQWADAFSTSLELGYDQVEYGDFGTNSAWKTTIAQNIALGSGTGSRPMIRVYATYGQLSTDVPNNHSVSLDTASALTGGVLFEAWW